MILHEHKHKTDELNLNKIDEEFIARNDKRKYTFGTVQNYSIICTFNIFNNIIMFCFDFCGK